MSVTGIGSSILSTLSGLQNQQSPFQQIKSEFQQLGQDLQSGNLTQAQSDFTTLTQNLSNVFQGGTNTATAATTPANTAAATTSPILQAFNQLGQDLQSGNLQAAQQDFTNIQQDAQQAAPQVGGHHHHHHADSSQGSSRRSKRIRLRRLSDNWNRICNPEIYRALSRPIPHFNRTCSKSAVSKFFRGEHAEQYGGKHGRA